MCGPQAGQDDNDEVPNFAQMAYDASVEEERPPGTTVTCITASDADEKENGRLRCTNHLSLGIIMYNTKLNKQNRG